MANVRPHEMKLLKKASYSMHNEQKSRRQQDKHKYKPITKLWKKGTTGLGGIGCRKLPIYYTAKEAVDGAVNE